MISLKNYGSDASSSEDESDNEKETGIKTEHTMHLKPISTALIVSGNFNSLQFFGYQNSDFEEVSWVPRVQNIISFLSRLAKFFMCLPHQEKEFQYWSFRDKLSESHLQEDLCFFYFLSLKSVSLIFQPVASAPHVLPNEGMDSRSLVDPVLKEIDFNPKFEDMYAPV